MLQQASEQYQNNLRILSIIVRAILFCGRQNIALRGHRDDHTSDAINKGNFIALLNLLAEFDETLNHLQDKLSLYFQNDSKPTARIIGDIIREEIMVDIRSGNKFFFHNCK